MWTLRKEDITRLEEFEMWIWHRMEKVNWTEHISNEEVLKLVEEERWIPVNDNKNETTELDGTYNERGLTSKRTNRRKNGG